MNFFELSAVSRPGQKGETAEYQRSRSPSQTAARPLQDFLLVLAKKGAIFRVTLELSQLGHLTFGFSSYSFRER
jgi:hypothetical protein